MRKLYGRPRSISSRGIIQTYDISFYLHVISAHARGARGARAMLSCCVAWARVLAAALANGQKEESLQRYTTDRTLPIWQVWLVLPLTMSFWGVTFATMDGGNNLIALITLTTLLTLIGGPVGGGVCVLVCVYIGTCVCGTPSWLVCAIVSLLVCPSVGHELGPEADA